MYFHVQSETKSEIDPETPMFAGLGIRSFSLNLIALKRRDILTLLLCLHHLAHPSVTLNFKQILLIFFDIAYVLSHIARYYESKSLSHKCEKRHK